MALSAKLELRQGQQLVMTPQLQQAIRLLQLSNMELVEFVDAEIERNPLLERDEGREDAREIEASEEREPVAAAAEGADTEWLDLEGPARRRPSRSTPISTMCFPIRRRWSWAAGPTIPVGRR